MATRKRKLSTKGAAESKKKAKKAETKENVKSLWAGTCLEDLCLFVSHVDDPANEAKNDEIETTPHLNHESKKAIFSASVKMVPGCEFGIYAQRPAGVIDGDDDAFCWSNVDSVTDLKAPLFTDYKFAPGGVVVEKYTSPESGLVFEARFTRVMSPASAAGQEDGEEFVKLEHVILHFPKDLVYKLPVQAEKPIKPATGEGKGSKLAPAKKKTEEKKDTSSFWVDTKFAGVIVYISAGDNKGGQSVSQRWTKGEDVMSSWALTEKCGTDLVVDFCTLGGDVFDSLLTTIPASTHFGQETTYKQVTAVSQSSGLRVVLEFRGRASRTSADLSKMSIHHDGPAGEGKSAKKQEEKKQTPFETVWGKTNFRDVQVRLCHSSPSSAYAVVALLVTHNDAPEWWPVTGEVPPHCTPGEQMSICIQRTGEVSNFDVIKFKAPALSEFSGKTRRYVNAISPTSDLIAEVGFNVADSAAVLWRVLLIRPVLF